MLNSLHIVLSNDSYVTAYFNPNSLQEYKDKHVKLRIDAIIFMETEVWKIVLNQKIHA